MLLCVMYCLICDSLMYIIKIIELMSPKYYIIEQLHGLF